MESLQLSSLSGFYLDSERSRGLGGRWLPQGEREAEVTRSRLIPGTLELSWSSGRGSPEGQTSLPRAAGRLAAARPRVPQRREQVATQRGGRGGPWAPGDQILKKARVPGPIPQSWGHANRGPTSTQAQALIAIRDSKVKRVSRERGKQWGSQNLEPRDL